MAYVFANTTNQSDMKPHERDASPARWPGLRLPSAEVVGFKREHHKPSYRSVTPLDAGRLPTFN
jgi:hypothetical protein